MAPLTRANGKFYGDRTNINLVIQDFNTVTIYEVDSKGGCIRSARDHSSSLLTAWRHWLNNA